LTPEEAERIARERSALEGDDWWAYEEDGNTGLKSNDDGRGTQ
jgi:hypothetical protein